MKKIVICPDSFKGSLGAVEVADTIADAIGNIFPSVKTVRIPLADGGEGTADIICKACYPRKESVFASDPLGRKILTEYFIDDSGKKGFIESAGIIGLPLLKPEERNPVYTDSYGLGEVICDAIRKECEEITVALGGSATCDAGEGMLKALEESGSFSGIKFKVVCDVTNPLLGENGAVRVFAPQKGAKPEDLPLLEERLESFARKAIEKGLCNQSDLLKEGAGAAGGLGFAFQTYLKAHTIKGIDFVLESVNFENAIDKADLIITGEGKIDEQSLMGKVISGVLKKAKQKNIPVIALGGIIENEKKLREAGLEALYSIVDPSMSLRENMLPEITKANIKNTIERICMLKNNIFEQIIH